MNAGNLFHDHCKSSKVEKLSWSTAERCGRVGYDTVVVPASRTRVLVLPAPLLIRLLSNAHSKAAQDGSSTWAPATHPGDPDKLSGS